MCVEYVEQTEMCVEDCATRVEDGVTCVQNSCAYNMDDCGTCVERAWNVCGTLWRMCVEH